ncbi:hypothetical protein SteCoe_20301 [Stentor coeruleus]|uniref:Uncharacterized protein n=1 Tax=Stentor coeruleus TaxID=5963 RepID=A0A1R2BSI8_9CILI|nr:hypothetical protein SteCoe_36291 [Stentor coeruleus]OMJ79627.1 hypothetical protein SteCoe_20301 [Stentor coeruleus]
MNVKLFGENFFTQHTNLTTSTTQPTARIIPKHKKSVSNANTTTNIPSSYAEIKILNALTPIRIAEAEYKQRDIYDWTFDLTLNKSFKETQELLEKRKKYEERKWKEEDFNALKEVKNKIKEEEVKRERDDMKREQERFMKNQDLIVEIKKRDNQFKQDKRVIFMENNYIKKRMQWGNKLQEREMSLDSLKLYKNTYV